MKHEYVQLIKILCDGSYQRNLISTGGTTGTFESPSSGKSWYTGIPVRRNTFVSDTLLPVLQCE